MPSLIPPGVPGNHPHAGRIAPTAAETTRRQTTTTDQNRTESNKIGVQFDRTELKNLKKPEKT